MKVIGRGRGVRARRSAATRRTDEAVGRTAAKGAGGHMVALRDGRRRQASDGGGALKDRAAAGPQRGRTRASGAGDHAATFRRTRASGGGGGPLEGSSRAFVGG